MQALGEKAGNIGARRLVDSLAIFALRHGTPIVFGLLIWYVLWWGHSPSLSSIDAAMWHVSWVGIVALVYVALQARAVLAQPRTGVAHAMVEILVSLVPLLIVAYAFVEWVRGLHALSVFQVIVMVQASLATLIDVVIFTWFSMSLSRLSTHAIEVR